MPQALLLSTWAFGRIANRAGWPYLAATPASCLDAVEHACRAVEADPSVTSVGRGGLPDRSGEVSLDAAVMLSPSRCGAVCYVRGFLHAVSIARLVMERTPHVMLAGEGAQRFARQLGMTGEDLLTDQSRAAWERWDRESHDTVGVLARDPAGHLAAACSTSGLAGKLPGRVGDSPIIGHGLYVDPEHGAAVATGTGELIMGVCGSFLAVEGLRRGASPRDAAAAVLARIQSRFTLRPEHQVAVLVLSPAGSWSAAALRPGYCTAVRTAGRDELVEPECIMLAEPPAARAEAQPVPSHPIDKP